MRHMTINTLNWTVERVFDTIKEAKEAAVDDDRILVYPLHPPLEDMNIKPGWDARHLFYGPEKINQRNKRDRGFKLFRDPKSRKGPFKCGDVVKDPREPLGYEGGAKRVFVLCEKTISKPATDEAIYMVHTCVEHGVKGKLQNVKPIHGEDLLDYTITVHEANLLKNYDWLYLEKTDHERYQDQAAADAWQRYTGRQGVV